VRRWRLRGSDIPKGEDGAITSSYLPSTFLASLKDPEFALPSVEGIEAMLAQAGFEQVSKGHVLSDYVMIGSSKSS
jgi:hypothetical protein